MRGNVLTIVTIFLTSFFLYGQNNKSDISTNAENLELDNLFDMTLDELLQLNIENTDKAFSCYGFINANVEQVFDAPQITEEGNRVFENGPINWSPVQNFHIYGSQNLSNKISIFFNLAHNGSEVLEIRNAYGNFLIKDFFQIRIGKMYRNFGLYNSKLDQIPTFIGIEPPELFDNDHLFLTRTTSFALHGAIPIRGNQISYFLSTENGEGGPRKSVIPLGWDFRFKSDDNNLIVGTSGFLSGGNVSPIINDLNPISEGGVLSWMQTDRFYVFGLFVEKKIGNILLQSEMYLSPHDAIRDATKTLDIVKNATISESQRKRFLSENSDKTNEVLTESDIVKHTSYVAKTWYVRLGYDIQTRVGQFVPYVFFDYMSHPEIIQNKRFGGDNEAGVSDDGVFYKPSLGLLYRPQPEVAIKFDGSLHAQQVNGEMVAYPEIRLDFSFAFDVLKGLKK